MEKRILQWRKGRHAWMMGHQQEQSNEENHKMEGISEYDDLELAQLTSLPPTGRGNIRNHNYSAFAVVDINCRSSKCSDGLSWSIRRLRSQQTVGDEIQGNCVKK